MRINLPRSPHSGKLWKQREVVLLILIWRAVGCAGSSPEREQRRFVVQLRWVLAANAGIANLPASRELSPAGTRAAAVGSIPSWWSFWLVDAQQCGATMSTGVTLIPQEYSAEELDPTSVSHPAEIPFSIISWTKPGLAFTELSTTSSPQETGCSYLLFVQLLLYCFFSPSESIAQTLLLAFHAQELSLYSKRSRTRSQWEINACIDMRTSTRPWYHAGFCEAR